MKRWIGIVAFGIVFSFILVTTSFAGEWKQNDSGWWYENDDGTYQQNKWVDVEGTQYFFNSDGYWVDGAKPLTLENYAKIADGMTYDEVVEILGKPASHDYHGDIGMGTEYVSDAYSWQSKTGYSISSMIFIGGKVNVKTIVWTE